MSSTSELAQPAVAAGAPASLRRSVIRLPAVPYVVLQRGVAYVPLPGVSATAGP